MILPISVPDWENNALLFSTEGCVKHISCAHYKYYDIKPVTIIYL